MRSHTYLFSTREFVRTVAAPLFGAVVLAAILHSVGWLGGLPPARGIDNPDETVVAVKSQLSSSSQAAQVILLGDSACATGVDALALRDHLPGKPGVLNLGLYIGFGLEIYGEVLANYVRHNPNDLRWVVLIVTPRFLSDQSAVPSTYEFWRRRHFRQENVQTTDRSYLAKFFGLSLLKDRVLRQVLNTPIPHGRFFGFSRDLARYLELHAGSMIEPGVFRPPAHPVLDRYELAPTLEGTSRDFRRRLPNGAKLAIGLAPIPDSLGGAEYVRKRALLLDAWNQWLRADLVLTNAPAKLPDTFFASGDHPNPAGQALFTRQLAGLLRQRME